jgi:hypothetical protein
LIFIDPAVSVSASVAVLILLCRISFNQQSSISNHESFQFLKSCQFIHSVSHSKIAHIDQKFKLDMQQLSFFFNLLQYFAKIDHVSIFISHQQRCFESSLLIAQKIDVVKTSRSPTLDYMMLNGDVGE